MDFSRFNTKAQDKGASYDEGLRSYMLQIYNYMSLGLGLTGIVAYLTASSPALLQVIFGTPLQYLVIFSPLIIVLFLSFKLQKLSVSTAQMMFWLFATLMGLSLSSVFLIYTGASIARAFFITSTVFGAMSLYGYTTKKDLTSMGSFMMMGLIGIIVLSVVNMFLQSTAMQFMISAAALFIFIGLTAYDTQKLKTTYYRLGGDSDMAKKVGIMGALSLYLDFINIFIHLLRFVGDRK
jgi:FtsH-binding integral membrane protein